MNKSKGLAQKTEQKQKTVQVLISKVTQKLDVRQNLRSLLILSLLTGAAIAGRAALQYVPSVETVTPFAIFSGFILGPVYGFTTGASSFYLSNFLVWGGQGPWTIFQCLGAGAAGFLAGIIGKKWKNFKLYMLATALGIIAYELIITIPMGIMWTGLVGLPWYLITSLPFSAVHLVSSLGLCAALWGARSKLPKLGAKIVEKTKFLFSKVDNSNDTSSSGNGGGLFPEQLEHELWREHGDKRELVHKLRWKKSGSE